MNVGAAERVTEKAAGGRFWGISTFFRFPEPRNRLAAGIDSEELLTEALYSAIIYIENEKGGTQNDT